MLIIFEKKKFEIRYIIFGIKDYKIENCKMARRSCVEMSERKEYEKPIAWLMKLSVSMTFFVYNVIVEKTMCDVKKNTNEV